MLEPEHLIKNAPGAVGAFVALGFIRGPTWWHTLFSYVGGCACSIYGSDYVVNWTGADAGLAGFLLGLFGMAVVSKMHEAIAAFRSGDLVSKILGKWGL